MKTTKFTLSFVTILIAGLFFISSCSGNQQSKDETANPEVKEEKKEECPMDNPNTLVIVATLTIKNEADKADLENALHAVVDGTRTEEGNISYVLHQDVNNPLTYVIIEVWKSQDAINTHNETAHFKAFVEAVGNKADLSVNTIKKVY
jgi:quinol monooxygenase YgiN